MKNFTKLFSLGLILVVGVLMFTGCGESKQQYTVSFMTPYNITYTEESGVDCSYAVYGGGDKTVNYGEVVGTVSINTQYGAGNLFRFDGWFTEEECINAWDLYRDEVKCNLVLYAKYVRV